MCGKVRGQPARGSALPPACGSQGLNSSPKTGAPTTEPTQQTTSPCLKSKFTHTSALSRTSTFGKLRLEALEARPA